MGLEPDGGTPAQANSRVDLRSQLRLWTRAEAARTGAFWTVLVGFFLCLGVQTAVLINQLAFLQEPDKLGSRSAAALAVTATTIGSIVARFIVGSFADRQDKRVLAVVLFLLQAGAICGYLAAGSTASIYTAALVFGFTVGNVYMVQSLLVGELFGMASFATVYGVISLASQVGSGLGLIGVGWLHDTTGGYRAPFLVVAALDVVAAAVVARTRTPAAQASAEPDPPDPGPHAPEPDSPARPAPPAADAVPIRRIPVPAWRFDEAAPAGQTATTRTRGGDDG
jgi:MFS family permease